MAAEVVSEEDQAAEAARAGAAAAAEEARDTVEAAGFDHPGGHTRSLLVDALPRR